VWLRLRSFDAIEYPCNTKTEQTKKIGSRRVAWSGKFNVARIKSNGLNFRFESDGGLSVFVKSVKPDLSPRAEDRIGEAMTFALGIEPRFVALTRSEGHYTVTRFRNFGKQAPKRMQWPPYKIEMFAQTDSVWRMFKKYLAFVLKDRDSFMHPLSQPIIEVDQSRNGFAQIIARVVTIAVEQVLKKFYSTMGQPSKAYIAQVDKAIDHSRKWDGGEKVKERIAGALEGFKASRPDDQLRVLVKKGIIADVHRRAWKKLRNAAAHGNMGGYDDNFQELLDDSGKVFVLFNQLIFHLIRYSGRQSDYGTSGWPDIDYPPTPVQTT
jgi:hypothetical protein